MNSEYPPGFLKPGDKYEIPAEGSLALLALGAKGITAWRKKRAEVMEQEKKNQAERDEQPKKE
jgi:hypothetical protein